MIDNNILKEKFASFFGEGTPRLFTAPGRINIIGEHTDYNGGFVLPGAVDKAITMAIVPNGTPFVNLVSIDHDDAHLFFRIGGPQPKEQWASYFYGVIEEMRKRGATVGGFNAVFGGDVPLGAGMSSSAALESCIGTALNALFDLHFTKEELAKIGQMTEHNYIGVRCGIMDQFASIFGQKGHVVRLDCRSLEYQLVPFNPKGVEIVLIDTMVKHLLASSEYNVRRAQCEEGVAVIKKYLPHVELLRDVTMEELEAHRAEMDPMSFRRCAFVINENKRLMDACAAMEKGDFVEVGKLVYATHEGLSKEYGVSCPELDFIVNIAHEHEAVLGARMMGGGFGGCVIALVKKEGVADYIADVKKRYQVEFDKDPRVIEVEISDGAREI
ncbi:MAG: galactokinase [Bacteroidales bacterium]|jgi:galactokinase|nr:galactokinase [Bacteroidales bacterium]MBR3065492.1 galactokinase [Bacteroidales bacterium]